VNNLPHALTRRRPLYRNIKIQSVAKDSKEWVEKNRVCDAPGSWYCRGQYPPALEKILKEKKDFKQLEDFNQKEGDDSEYQKKYFENLNRADGGAPPTPAKAQKLTATQIDTINDDWQDTDLTSRMYDMISQDQFADLRKALSLTPQLAHVRSADGRGPMFWAHEHRRTKIVELLKRMGVSETRPDADGITPLDILNSNT
jgi:dolichyl-diphosphooligosaccharide---protein glycosyltransferase